MSQTDEEKIRKIYAKDLKVGDAVHTVFKAAGKDKITSRAGKTFLTLSLVDRTGEVDSRVFDNVEGAETAFNDGDYLLVKGKVIAFHGKPQLVIDTVERLDPGPIDAKEFAYTAPPAAEKPEPKHEASAPKAAGGHRGALKQRILELLDDPKVAQGLDALMRHFDAYIDERVAHAVRGGGGQPRQDKKPQVDRKPRVEFRARDNDKNDKHEKPAEKAPPPRDPSLPKDLTFKPLSMLAGEPAVSPAESSPKPETGN